ncbi:hypothetical protein [Bradyrhizobium sp. SSUT77]|uniref:hypothetical protein n=1 Tax=Bradyrhizobium sp. SSUT77 TaxID=3040603 RepID=UPI0024489FE2|nr:hypothetical protein [Bradyrhizobium sp. SSUT77]MDH2343451.1 hypothetical protein [Bradyrhizobium sp. SSUT77]
MFDEKSSLCAADAVTELAGVADQDPSNHVPQANLFASAEQALANAPDAKATVAPDAEGPLLKDAGEKQDEDDEEAEVGAEDEQEEDEKEESLEDIYLGLQEDEETRNYMPDFIKRMLDNPPLPAGMTIDFFRNIHTSVAESMLPHRPKSDLEFLAVFNATKAITRLMWLDDLINRLVHNNRREAVEALHHKLHAVVPSSKKEKDEHDRFAKEVAMDYFASPDHRQKFSSSLERGGFGADAVDTEAFQRSLPGLGKIETMRKAAIRERDQALKELERAYSSRDPEQRMPLSLAAMRNFFDEMREEKKLERQERMLEESKKAAQDGDT